MFRAPWLINKATQSGNQSKFLTSESPSEACQPLPSNMRLHLAQSKELHGLRANRVHPRPMWTKSDPLFSKVVHSDFGVIFVCQMKWLKAQVLRCRREDGKSSGGMGPGSAAGFQIKGPRMKASASFGLLPLPSPPGPRIRWMPAHLG